MCCGWITGGWASQTKPLAAFLNEEALFCGDCGTEYYADGQFYRYSIAVPPQEVERSMERLKQAASGRGWIKETGGRSHEDH